MSKNHRPRRDSLEEVIEAFQRMRVPDRPPDVEMLARLGGGRSGRLRPISIPSRSGKRGYLMRLLLPSAAAVLLFIGALGLLLLNGTAAIALAEVIKAAEKHKFVRYNEQQTKDTKGNGCDRVDRTVYADLTASRLRSETHVNYPDGEAVQVSIYNETRHLMTNSRRKTAWLGLAPKGYKSLLCCLEEFQQKQGVKQMPEKLGTLAMVKYHLEESKQTTSLWIDPKTKLPVRLEQEFIDPTPDVSRNKLIWSDFAWDPDVPSGFRNLHELFSTRPPDGYVVDEQTKAEEK